MRVLPLASISLAIAWTDCLEGQVAHHGLPENPCAIVTAQEVGAATHLDITEARRVPSIKKIVVALKRGKEPGPGSICSYRTPSDVGSISIYVYPTATNAAHAYEADRDRYFRTYPGSGRRVSGVGKDAWLGGGTSLYVLTQDNLRFTLTAQYDTRARGLLIPLAVKVVARFSELTR
jgi:hypothetical protein